MTEPAKSWSFINRIVEREATWRIEEQRRDEKRTGSDSRQTREKGDILLFGMMDGLLGCRMDGSGASPHLSTLNYQHEVEMEPG